MIEIERRHTNARMSKIVKHRGVVYLCGQTASRSMHAEGDVTAQAHEVLSRIDSLLASASSGRDKILSATIYLRDMTDFPAMNAVWESWMGEGAAPARTTVEARLASKNLLIEITVTAASAG